MTGDLIFVHPVCYNIFNFVMVRQVVFSTVFSESVMPIKYLVILSFGSSAEYLRTSNVYEKSQIGTLLNATFTFFMFRFCS